MPYTAQAPRPRESAEELRRRIPGWGADLDRAHRPAVPREQPLRDELRPPWTFPERQPATGGRERSIEHTTLPPVFGTALPLRGLSGVIRRLSYQRFSEARAAHWLLLLAADRVEVVGHRLGGARALGVVAGVIGAAAAVAVVRRRR